MSMDKIQLLLTRLDEIGRSLARREHTLALIGLGSVGLEGEKLSAARFIQNFAVDRLLELSERIEEQAPAPKDIFASERRFPTLANELPDFIQGYQHSHESAGAILDYLERRFEVNPTMAEAIRGLI